MTEMLFSEFESAGFGLVRDGRMLLAEYNERWAAASIRETQRILMLLNEPALRIFHIGSTSIPGIQAKPILDLLLATPSLGLLDSKQSSFEILGYECKGEFGLDGRRYYVLANKMTNTAYVHLHAWETDRPEILRHLVFRDYLRHHHVEAKRYEAIKISAVHKGADREKYLDSKAPIIDEIMKKAMAWAATPAARSLCSTEWQIVDESDSKDLRK